MWSPSRFCRQLGPLLFLVYINDFPNASSLNIRMFADDTMLFYSHKNSQNVQAIVNNELHKVSNFTKYY